MLEARDLRCERGARTLFSGLSFDLKSGEALRIAGANGSGKTSLLRILCGLLAPTQGKVLWNASEVAALREDYSTELVYLGHAAAVKDDLSAAENLAIACRLAGSPAAQATVEDALRRFGLPSTNVPVRKLSQGQRRRAALARLALSESRPLWLLDEPFSALDTEAISVVRGLISHYIAGGGAVAFTTHQDPGIAATRVIELG